MIQKNAYYLNFGTVQFLGGKELLKSMPTFFNRIYFCSKYGNALWDGEKEEQFSNIAMICKLEDIEMLRNIIKNNFLHIADWDSVKFSENGDYGFSFIGGNIKYILMPFTETESGYHIRYFDADTGMCSDIVLNDKNKQFFLDSSINNNGEFIRTCDFNLEESNETNTKKHLAEKKVQPELAVYNSNNGYATSAAFTWIGLIAISILTVLCAYIFIRMHI